MAEERIKRLEENQNKIDKKHNGVEQWIWKTVSAIGLSLAVWFLKDINSSLKTLSDEIVQIKLSDSANNQRMARLEEDVSYLKSSDVEFSKRVGTLERTSERHEQRLNGLERQVK